MSPSTTMKSWVEAAMMERATSEIITDIKDMTISTTETISQPLGDSSAIMGLNPAGIVRTPTKEVRFSTEVNVYEVPTVLPPKATNVTFSDDIVDISVGVSGSRDTPSPPKKRVRFSCLKHPKQPLSHGTSLLQLLRRGSKYTMTKSSAVAKSSVTTRKQVRFGALKCQKARYPDLTFGHRDTEWDEAETRRTFKREYGKHKVLQPLSTVNEADADDDWDST